MLLEKQTCGWITFVQKSLNFFLIMRFLLRKIFILSLLLPVRTVSFLPSRQANGLLNFPHHFRKTIVYREKRVQSAVIGNSSLMCLFTKATNSDQMVQQALLVLGINTLSINLNILKKIIVFLNFHYSSRNNAFNSSVPSCRHQYYREM